MKILLDTNIIVDAALEREPYVDASREILLLVEQGQIEGYISASTFSDIYYIVGKARGKEWARNFLTWLLTYCKIATVNQEIIETALNSNFSDLEDAIQYSTALINQLDAIVTRNTQDFPVVNPRIITPDLFIQKLNNSV
ncbi:MAG: PIN domain-containing protein [Okeania sp. SIO2F4]|uniref:type II toxin-antitoxin system VapC family toxin n=1 Tax=Okeania sp. SIO2F4 TaxID=2607790 RepID=UPI001428DCCF|nr:PIN domain-containing protein [Okeania sp. SIO2F4]NES05446.1 PIN domain-containing protein [Okeania sp. SIO2F4]